MPNQVQYRFVQVYPNPVSINIDYIYSSVHDLEFIKVYDIYGKLIFIPEIRHQRIDVSGLVTGIYIIQFIDVNGNSLTQKIFKE